MESKLTNAIAERIKAEYRKHPSLDWAMLAAKKIVAAHFTDSFICEGCKHDLPMNFNMRTPGYCYLCDPNVTVDELLEEIAKAKNHKAKGKI